MFEEDIKKLVYLFIGLLIIGTGIWFYKLNSNSNIEDLNLKTNGKEIKYYDAGISENVDSNYYQVYVYPESYDFKCSETSKECLIIQKKIDSISGLLIGYFTQDNNDNFENFVKISINDKINSTKEKIVDFLENKINNKDLLSKLQDSYNLSYEEKDCIENINSSSLGTPEEIIIETIKSACNYSNNPFFENLEENIKNQNSKIINGNLEINKLKVIFKFYNKTDNGFIEKSSNEKILELDKKLNFELNINVD